MAGPHTASRKRASQLHDYGITHDAPAKDAETVLRMISHYPEADLLAQMLGLAEPTYEPRDCPTHGTPMHRAGGYWACRTCNNRTGRIRK